MKKTLALVLSLVLTVVCAFPAFASDGATCVTVNGEAKNLIAYNIAGNNYFKLRDVANILKGTDAQFDVVWNASLGSVEITSGVPYSTAEDVTDEVLTNPVALPSITPIYKDGAQVLLAAYNIGGNNYFKLRDLGAVIGFGVDWTLEQGIMIDTAKEYVYPVVSDFALNVETLGLVGKTKAQVDAKFGQGTYSWEFGMVDYGNGIMLGYNSLGGEPADTDCASTMYVSMDKLFYNCPDTLSPELIASAFTHTYSYTDEMDGAGVLSGFYCGKSIDFYTDYGINRSSYAFININNPYPGAIEGVKLSTEEQSDNVYIDFVGYYTDPETQSCFTLMFKNMHWTADMYLVRVLSGEYECEELDFHTLLLKDEFAGSFEMKWSDDYSTVTVTNLEYADVSTPWVFYKQ